MNTKDNHELTWIEKAYHNATKGESTQHGIKAIVIRGKPGSGKSHLSNALVSVIYLRFLNRVKLVTQINADLIRQTLNKDLGFSYADRIKQAQTLGYLAKFDVLHDRIPIVDFVMPNQHTYNAFVQAFGLPFFLIECSVNKEDRYQDTSAMYQPLTELGHGDSEQMVVDWNVETKNQDDPLFKALKAFIQPFGKSNEA